MEHLMLAHGYWLQHLMTQHSDGGLIAGIRFQNREKLFGHDRRYAQRAAHEDVERPHDG
jgi:hypothetical protein